MILSKSCRQCLGNGTIPSSDTDPTPVECNQCNGKGYEDWGMIDDSDITDKLNDVLDKLNDVLDKLNSA
jgi:hypothetical protein